MSLLTYTVPLCTWSPVGSTIPANLPAVGGYTVVDTHEDIWQGGLSFENDAQMTHYLSVVADITLTGQSLAFRIYDVTNSAVIVGPTATKNGVQNLFDAYNVATVAPIATLVSSDARFQLQYNGGGTACRWYSATWFMSRKL